MSPLRAALDRLANQETDYDRRIGVAVLLTAAYLAAWAVLHS